MIERRSQATIRRDVNDLVRTPDGSLSPTKIGTLVGQWLAVKLILENGKEIIANWDSLTILFGVLIAPELIKKTLNLKYAGNGTTTITDSTTDSTTSARKVEKKSAANTNGPDV